MSNVKEKNNSIWNMYSIDLENTTIYNIFTKAGNYRWWKIYSNDKKVIIVSWLVKIITFEWWKDKEILYRSWNIIDIEAGIAHIFYFMEDSEFIEYFPKDTKSEKFNRYYNMKD
jgi:hypothetical protein